MDIGTLDLDILGVVVDHSFGSLEPPQSVSLAFRDTFEFEYKYLYGASVKEADIRNLIRPFTWPIWICVIVSIVSAACLLIFARWVYMKISEPGTLMKAGLTKSDVVIKIISTMTEPEGVEFFRGWSVGKNFQNNKCTE